MPNDKQTNRPDELSIRTDLRAEIDALPVAVMQDERRRRVLDSPSVEAVVEAVCNVLRDHGVID